MSDSIFPFIDVPDGSGTEGDTDLPLYREYAYDYIHNRLLLRDGKPFLIEGNDALQVWIYFALRSARFRFTAYSPDYGSEIDNLIGQPFDGDITALELRRYITEALMINPYIEELSGWQTSRKGSHIFIGFDCRTIYGTMPVNYDYKE